MSPSKKAMSSGEAAMSPRPSERPTGLPTAPEVLVIEDDPDYAYILRRMLTDRSAGAFPLEHVDRLENGLDRLQRGGIDVVLLDLDLPDSFGLETFLSVHNHAPEVPVVVLTGLDDETVAVNAVRKGAQDYLVKGDFGNQLLARAIRYAIERNELQLSLRSLSLEDDLTGLYNRRGFVALAGQQLKMARRNDVRLLVMFADLDGLKAINDAHGHVTGSEAIVEAAGVLRQTFRDSDILARFGGDEFVIMLPDTGAEAFDVPAQRLRRNLEAWNGRKARPYRLSMSLGAAAYDPEKPLTLYQLIERADKAMYRDKRRRSQARLA